MMDDSPEKKRQRQQKKEKKRLLKEKKRLKKSSREGSQDGGLDVLFTRVSGSFSEHDYDDDDDDSDNNKSSANRTLLGRDDIETGDDDEDDPDETVFPFGRFPGVFPSGYRPKRRTTKVGQVCGLIITFSIYLLGAGAMVFYGYKVFLLAPYQEPETSVGPVVGHIVGIFIAVVLKFYYELSENVGHVEAMHIIARSKFWLFPGVLPGSLRRRKRSAVERRLIKRDELLSPRKGSGSGGGGGGGGGGGQSSGSGRGRTTATTPASASMVDEAKKLPMTSFLRSCHFPELRVLFESMDAWPWHTLLSHPSRLGNRAEVDGLSRRISLQVFRAFPILDALSCGTALPTLFNPVRMRRWIGNFTKSIANQRGAVSAEEIDPLHEVATEMENIEFDDVSNASQTHLWERKEPLPWGTVRSRDFRAKFRGIVLRVNIMGTFVFCLMLLGYIYMVFGEMHFHHRLRRALALFEYQELQRALKKGLNLSPTDGDVELSNAEKEALADWHLKPGVNRSSAYLRRVEDSNAWAEEYADFAEYSATGAAHLTLLLILPFAIQASALIAENVAVTLTVLDTLQVHVENFIDELDDFFLVLAVNHGSLPDDEKQHGGARQMSREMALVWRMNRFFYQVSADSNRINSAVFLLVLNLGLHMIPLNLFVNSANTCLPLWIINMTIAQTVGLVYVVNSGIACNELMDEKIDGLLDSWTLRLNMIEWSGGFVQEPDKRHESGGGSGEKEKEKGKKKKDDDDDNEPDGFTEHELDIYVPYEARGASSEEWKKYSKLNSIVKVLAHYKQKQTRPFRVLGVTCTREFILLLIGLFSGAIFGVIAGIIRKNDERMINPCFMCHPQIQSGAAAEGEAGAPMGLGS